MLDKIDEINNLLSVGHDACILIARQYQWSTDKIYTTWFEQKDKLQYALGIAYDKSLDKDPKVNLSLPSLHGGYCLVCYEGLTGQNKFSLACRHEFCVECWKDYLRSQLTTDITGLDTKCMQSGCNLKVGHTSFLKLL